MAPTQTHTHIGTHTCVHNTPPGSTPPTLPTQRSCHLAACLRDLQSPCSHAHDTHMAPTWPQSPDTDCQPSPSGAHTPPNLSPPQAHMGISGTPVLLHTPLCPAPAPTHIIKYHVLFLVLSTLPQAFVCAPVFVHTGTHMCMLTHPLCLACLLSFLHFRPFSLSPSYLCTLRKAPNPRPFYPS